MKNISKKDPLGFGEYLVKRMKSENVTQTQLASILGENRTELGRYVKIGKWSANFKSYLFKNKDKISNTHLIKAARDFRYEHQAIEYIENIVTSAGGHSNQPVPIRNEHMLDNLVRENRKLESEICELKECIISLNRKISNLPSCTDTPSQRSELTPLDEADTQKACITRWLKIRDTFSNIFNHRFTAMCVILWVCLIPVTAMFIEHCLKSFSFDKVQYLSSLPLSLLALMLAITIDLLIFSLLKLDHWPARVCGSILIALNCCGAYFISSKNTSALDIEAYQSKLLSKEARIVSLEEKVANLYAKYLSTKWPNQANPYGCESKEVDCGLPFSTKAQEIHTEFLAAQNLLDSKMGTLKEMESLPISLKQTSLNDVYWHLGYYILLWILLLLTAWMQHITSKNIVRRVWR